MTLAVVAAVATLVPPAAAAPLHNWRQILHQPDGTVVSCFSSGDEYFNFLHDEAGYVIMRDSQGWLTYAVRVGEELQPSAHLVGRTDPKALGIEPWLRPGQEVLQRKWERFNPPGMMRSAVAAPAPGFTTVNNIVLFICFYDEDYSIFSHSASQYDGIYNSTATGANSVRNYFKEASYSQLTMSTYLPTSGGYLMIWKTGYPRAYFEPYGDGANPYGYQSDDEAAQREHLLLKEVIEGYVDNDLIPSTLNVDTNNDGYVDNVTFMVSGQPGEWSDLLWPHRWSLSQGYPVSATINGKTVEAYNFNLDAVTWKEGGSAAGGGVGTLCHEMTHTLGAPDLYHYKESAQGLNPVGSWDIMESTTDPPQHPGAYMKMRYMGWINSIPSITTTGTYTLNPVTSSTQNAYKIASPYSSTQYFIVEYRRKTGYFESGLPGSGLIVYRIDTSVSDGSGNMNGPPDEVYVYRPGGSPTLNGEVDLAHFSSEVGRTAINDTTDPKSHLSNGANGGLNISQVGSAGSTISFKVTIGGSSTCTYSITPTSASIASGVGSGTIQVTTQTGCTWSATSSAAWLGITSGSSGSGNGSVAWSATANTSASSRTATISVGGKTFTATQSGTGGGGSYVYWVETAAKAGGVGTANWLTDLGVLNLGSGTANATFQIFSGTNPQGTDTIPAGAQKIYGNVAGQLGITNAAGALKITSNQPLAVTSRTYNDQGTNGTFGQYYDGYTAADMLSAGATVRLAQLTENAKYRTNIAVTNTGSGTAQARITLYSATGVQLKQFTMDLNPYQRKQENQVFKNRASQTNMNADYAKIEILSGTGIIVSASVIDNTTGDPTTIPPKM